MWNTVGNQVVHISFAGAVKPKFLSWNLSYFQRKTFPGGRSQRISLTAPQLSQAPWEQALARVSARFVNGDLNPPKYGGVNFNLVRFLLFGDDCPPLVAGSRASCGFMQLGEAHPWRCEEDTIAVSAALGRLQPWKLRFSPPNIGEFSQPATRFHELSETRRIGVGFGCFNALELLEK